MGGYNILSARFRLSLMSCWLCLEDECRSMRRRVERGGGGGGMAEYFTKKEEVGGEEWRKRGGQRPPRAMHCASAQCA